MRIANDKACGFGYLVPPLLDHVRIYFDQKGLTLEAADEFYKEYKNCRWKTKTGKSIRNWKVLASHWVWLRKHQKPLAS